MDVGLHWHLDDPVSVVDPLILGIAKDISLGKDEGIIYNRLGAPEEKVDNFKFEIYDRSRTALTGTIGNGGGTGWDDTTVSALPLPASSIGIITVGDVLDVVSEQVVVKAVNRTANTIDVWKRGHGGSTAATHSDTTAFKIIGKAIHDVDLKNVESFAEQTGKYENYPQVFVETIDMTFTDDIQARKVFQERPQLIAEALDRMFRRLSSTTILGRKEVGTKSPQVPATTAGLLHQLSDGGGVRTPLRYNATGVTDPETILKNALISVWNQGGNPTAIYINPANKRKFDPLMDQFIRTTRSEAGVIGTENGTAYMYQGKEIPFVQDQDMPIDRIEIVTERKLRKGWRVGDMLRGPIQEPQNSSRELRFSLQGSFFIVAKGVGVDHIDCYNVSI